MKYIYFSLLFYASFFSLNAQIVGISDINFKNAIIDYGHDKNGDGEIQESEALDVNILKINNRSIVSLVGIEYFVNLEILECTGNELTSLDVTNNLKLKKLLCDKNQISYINVENNVDLEWFDSSENLLTELNVTHNRKLVTLESHTNQLTEINISQNVNLESLNVCDNEILEIDVTVHPNLYSLWVWGNDLSVLDLTQNPLLRLLGCWETNLSTLDITQNPLVSKLYCWDNPFLESLFIKNGSNQTNGYFVITPNPSLKYICVDEEEYNRVRTLIGYRPEVNTYCSFVPGGKYYEVKGDIFLDDNFDGCDVNDNPYVGMSFDISNTVDYRVSFVNQGDYTIPLQEGEAVILPVLENPEYFTVSPASITVDFTGDDDVFIQDFCIEPVGIIEDLEVSIIPLGVARPGFDVSYKIIYKNKGTVTISGKVDLHFDDDSMDLIMSNPLTNGQSQNTLSWDFDDLVPNEVRKIKVDFNLNSPIETPSLNHGDFLKYKVHVSSVNEDEYPQDNSLTLIQNVINSFDPNDKACLEGNIITPNLIGEYVHYLIRCENTGTAEAINIVIKDVIDISKFDISSLVITDSSHSMLTRINNNVVEFIFENIHLPFDDANNDGYVAFKIKTLPSLQVGDTFENDAEIFFDYNAPIETNIAQTSIQNSLGLEDFKLSNSIIKIYPNPVNDKFFLESEEIIESVEVYSISGILIQQISIIGHKNDIEIPSKSLSQGTYFVKVNTDLGAFYKKLIKK